MHKRPLGRGRPPLTRAWWANGGRRWPNGLCALGMCHPSSTRSQPLVQHGQVQQHGAIYTQL